MKLCSAMLNVNSSGVAIGYPAPWSKKIFLRPLSTKPTEFVVRNSCKSAEEAKTEYLL